MIVATAGHIDHGKTTLVRALTGVDTDRLPEEKARGISIDLGFAYWPLADGRVIGFVDVPGHERFVRNMVAGVGGIDCVLLVVAADDGVMPQTIEHLCIVDLLDVTRGIAVVTKVDRVSSERADEVVSSVTRLLASTALAGAPVLRVSAATGDGLDALRAHLREAAAAQERRDVEGRHFRFAIDRAFTIAGSGTVVTGTVFSGAVAPSDPLALVPSARPVRVRALQKHGSSARNAVAGERCALNLAGVEVREVARGDWAVAPAIAVPTSGFDARVRVLASELHPVRHWTPVHVHLATASVMGRLALRRGDAIPPGGSAQARILLDRPIGALRGDRFIVRDQSATRTLGGGRVIDPLPPVSRRSSPARRATLDALEHDGVQDALAALFAPSARGVDVQWCQTICNLTPARFAEVLRGADGVVVGKEARTALPRRAVDAMKSAIASTLASFHRASPQAAGVAIADLRRDLAPGLGAEAFLHVLRELATAGAIEIAGAVARASHHVTTANPEDEALWQRVRPVLDQAGLALPTLHDAARAAAVDEKSLRDLMFRKSRTGDVFRVGKDRFYPRGTLARLAAIAHALDGRAGGRGFSAAQFRDATGIGRALGIEILECLDRLGITQRVGDARKLRKDFVPILGDAPAR